MYNLAQELRNITPEELCKNVLGYKLNMGLKPTPDKFGIVPQEAIDLIIKHSIVNTEDVINFTTRLGHYVEGAHWSNPQTNTEIRVDKWQNFYIKAEEEDAFDVEFILHDAGNGAGHIVALPKKEGMLPVLYLYGGHVKCIPELKAMGLRDLNLPLPKDMHVPVPEWLSWTRSMFDVAFKKIHEDDTVPMKYMMDVCLNCILEGEEIPEEYKPAWVYMHDKIDKVDNPSKALHDKIAKVKAAQKELLDLKNDILDFKPID